MAIQQSQIKIYLSTNLKKYLERKAVRYGITVTGYIKYLIIQDLEDADSKAKKSLSSVIK